MHDHMELRRPYGVKTCVVTSLNLKHLGTLI